MSNPLGERLQALSRAFVQDIVDAMQRSSLAEILEVTVAPVKRRRGRPPGPARYKVEETVSAVVAYVRRHPGLGAKEVREALGLERSPWNVAVARAVAARAIRRTGPQRRARYFPG